MKQNLLQNFKFILIGVILAAGLSFAYADGWVAPSTTAPGSNVPVPLHTGPTQVKNGSLGVGTFAVNANAQFAQNTYINGIVRGGTPSTVNSTANIGGLDTDGSAHIVPVTVAGDTSVTGAISNDAVKNGTSSNLCAKADGTITLCNVSSGTANPTTVTVTAGPSGTTGVFANISQLVLTPVTATVYYYIDKTIAGCNAPTTSTLLGTFTIPAFTLTSSNSFPLPGGNCPIPDITYTVTSVSPTTSTTGQPIVGQ